MASRLAFSKVLFGTSSIYACLFLGHIVYASLPNDLGSMSSQTPQQRFNSNKKINKSTKKSKEYTKGN